MVKDSDTLVAIPLRSYCANQWVQYEETPHGKIPYILAGDSAMGVPFFRSFNNGLEASSSLAKDVAFGVLHEGGLSLKRYRFRMTFLAIREFLVAKIQSLAIKFFEWLLHHLSNAHKTLG